MQDEPARSVILCYGGEKMRDDEQENGGQTEENGA